MKVLIADDEYHVIQAIRLLVPWEELGINQILTASCGAEALEIIDREIPEIVITDIVMEDKSGIDIMDFIASRHPSIRVIAVSGHNDFDYVRTMLTKGCLDYLLKPLESSTLIETVQKAADSWNQQQEASRRSLRLQEKVRSLSSFYSTALLLKMLNPANRESAFQELLQADHSFADISSCRFLYYDSGFFPLHNPDFSALLQRFEEQVQKLPAFGENIILSNPNAPGEHALFLYGSIDTQVTSVLKLAQTLFQDRRYPFHIGVGREHLFPDQFSEAYFQAKNAFLSAYGDACSSSMAITTIASETDVFLPDPGELRKLEDQIFSALLIGHKKELETAVSSWLSYALPQKDITLHQIHSVIESFQELNRQWLSRIKKQRPEFSCPSFEAPLNYRNLTDENFLFSRSFLEQTILSCLFDVCDAMILNRSSADVMHQIVQYMELNYAKPFIQSEYAKQFYMNKDYMSRKFTNTFGVNMLAYLNQIRIRHAKELLSDSSLKVQDIAYAVGFRDEKYFAKQFKKLTGASPGDYRNTLKNSAN